MFIGGLQKTTLIDYPGFIACTVFTAGCNFHCGYCHNPELQNFVSAIQYDHFLQFLQTRQGKLEGVVISGGEPTIQSDITGFLQTIKQMGYKIKLDTQGSMPDVIAELMNKKLIDSIAMDVKAPLSKYPIYTDLPDVVEKIKTSIQIIMQAEIDYEFRTTLVKEDLSLSDIEEIAQVISGAKKYCLQQFRPKKTLDEKYATYTTYSEAELRTTLQKIAKSVETCIVR